MSSKALQNQAAASEEQRFQETFEWILENLNEFMLEADDKNIGGNGTQNTLEWLKTVMIYNVPHGKQIRGRLVASAYKQLNPNAGSAKQQLSCVLGWCLEILQASFLVADDIMDNGVTRRGHPCWYRVNNMGNIAFNDALLLEHVAYDLLRINFSHLECYPDLQQLFLGVVFKTVMGQSLDTRMGKIQNYDEYTIASYHSIVTYKTGYYTAYLPVALAMVFAGLPLKSLENEQLWKSVKEISLKIGTLFQIQDDYLDCFGDSDKLGKMGSDIQEGKCTWLFVTAKQICTELQLRILKANYGSTETNKVNVVREIYQRLNLPLRYKMYRDNLYEEVKNNIKLLEHFRLQNILLDCLESICKREY